jgi:hypothetical protein
VLFVGNFSSEIHSVTPLKVVKRLADLLKTNIVYVN